MACPIKIKFGTKAETLSLLEGRLTTATVLPQVTFTVTDWIDAQCDIYTLMPSMPTWMQKEVVVRSSALAEDTLENSLAGHFRSILQVTGREQLEKAINSVISSFAETDGRDQVLIQPMLTGVKASGVVFSRDPATGGYYYVINYDDQSGKTDTVTSGSSNELNVFYAAKEHSFTTQGWINRVLLLIRELEDVFDNDSLDVEFAVNCSDELFLLQVRPLIIRQHPRINCTKQNETLRRIAQRISSLSRPHPYLLGKRTLFGVMPDWNPAEIIGIRPRPLSLSLYKEIITDNIWAYQRDNYGYRNLRSFPLLIEFSGLPYIDVRVSFNSFIPGDLDRDLAGRLADYYLDYLAGNPEHHDKVEFEIIFSCYTLDLPERLEVLLQHGFQSAELQQISNSLRQLTNTIIHDEKGLWRKDIARLDTLQQRQEAINESDLPVLDKIYWLLEDCKRYGTLPFAGLARAGFIAVQLLRSLIQVGVLTENDYDCFLQSLSTVSSTMCRDLQTKNRDAFLRKYGHLRPGTYDILSPRYDEEPEQYFIWDQTASRPDREQKEFTLSISALNRLKKILITHRIEHDAVSFLNFIKEAIEGREFAKFIFTRSLSQVIVNLKNLGKKHNFSEDDLSYLDIDIVKKLYGSSESIRDSFAESIRHGKQKYNTTSSLVLPDLIIEPEDVWAFQLSGNEPNFITLQSIRGQVITALDNQSDFANNILMIPSADPGFDWIFSHNPGGFITMYGGANSHMAIRAGELGIPAVIGAGSTLFNLWKDAEVLRIDCANRQVKIIR